MATNNLGKLWQLVRKYCDEQDEELVALILDDERFQKGAGGASHHHAYSGGLVDHTLEVAEYAMSMTDDQRERRNALIAAIFHDYGKIHDYKIGEDGTVSNTDFCRLIGHLPWSWHFFVNAAEEMHYGDSWVSEISHALLAHHGRKEWKSPVEPQTKLAFILHSADMLSMQGNKRGQS